VNCLLLKYLLTRFTSVSWVVLSLLLLINTHFFAQQKTGIQFIENKGQLPAQVHFNLSLNSGDLYLEGNKNTFCLYNKSQYADLRHGKTTDTIIKGHNYTVEFINGNPSPVLIKETPSTNYFNYFIGNDPSNWASEVRAYEKVGFQNLYPQIDILYYSAYGQVKYDFIVNPQGNTDDIQFKVNGAFRTYLEKGHLVIETNVGKVIEQSPYAYQIVNGKELQVACNYVLNNNTISFEFPSGYDKAKQLVIDPVLTFSTFTGSSASNFGCTATYDDAGNMYVGGTVFGVGYPSTTGAFQTNFAGGNIDMGISKFSSNGTNLVYSTYIGGSNNEIPHSLVVNSLNELLILGTSGSANYPVIAGNFQTAFAGGPNLNLGGGYGFNYNLGCDIVVTKMAANGNSILSSTFVGGSDNDGINFGSMLHYNYGDAFRGEIIVDANDNILVSSMTKSTNFPVSAGAPQPSYGGGGSDAVVFKLNSNLTNLVFSTYLGGSDFDAGYSVQLNQLNEVYVTGGTISTNYPTTPGALNTAYLGGTSDGFLTRLNPTGTAFLNSTYIGTSGLNQCFFVQTDLSNNVFVVGQTVGAFPISPGVYANPNSGQFIQKLSQDLSTSLLSTTIGRGSGQVDISLTAFLVSDCNFIYLCGWGGPLNGNTSISAFATQSTTTGLPTFGGAFQTTTNGSDFYLMVLAPDMANILYATFFGGGVSAEHADGGTSRFDKNGKVYQAVCAGCGGNSDFPTTTGAWSNFNNSTNCNLGAFKFDLGSITPTISLPQPFVCIPSSYQFNNNSTGANSYLWNFGDGNTSTQFAPSHVYTDTGTYEVTLIASDSLNCLQPDTAVILIDVFAVNNASVVSIDTICPNESIQLSASGGTTYQWFPAIYLSNDTIANPICTPPFTTNYMVVATDLCGSDTAYASVIVYNELVNAMNDTVICISNSVQLNAYGGTNYSWYPNTFMNNPGTQSPTVTPTSSQLYYVDITSPFGCLYTDSVLITVETNIPFPQLNNDTTICLGDFAVLSAQGGNTVQWSPANLVNNPNAFVTLTQPNQSTMYYAFLSNSCGGILDSTYVEVIQIIPNINPDTTICPGDSAVLWASGGDVYVWTPSNSLSAPSNDTTFAFPSVNTIYTVEISNLLGCTASLSTQVSIYPLPFVNAGVDINQNFGVPVTLNGVTTTTIFHWESIDSLSCSECLNPTVKPEQSTNYILYVIDENGCENSDTVRVILDGVLYVPNTFTPNGDGINDFFVTLGKDIDEYQLYIFDRWGILIFETNDLNVHWDGTYKGAPVPIDSYVWKIDYSDYQKNFYNLIGHVNVVR
jgi:gliding motility-associated-like protein